MVQIPGYFFSAVSFREKWGNIFPFTRKAYEKLVMIYYSSSISLWIKMNIPKFSEVWVDLLLLVMSFLFYL